MEISIYIDDSGQLHSNYYSDYFVYGGFWCLDSEESKIKSAFSKTKRQLFHTSKEIKSSNMQHWEKKRFLRKIVKEDVHPIYVVTKVSSLTIDFFNCEAVQLHKNYILRRLVEDALKQMKKLGYGHIKKVNLYIDNQSQTNVCNRDSFKNYINKVFKGCYKNSEYFLESDVDFKVEYMDSKSEPLIQVADLLANCKFQRFQNKSKDLKILLDKKTDTCCRKHPNFFSSESIA
ncbi:DUF3800 domain-containing protein [Enterococcus faecium]|uniref:DUF3800 domain-containing protein n=1 Tax=Enterococcus faecium TaxID=1352 RepID=UPI0028100674|nr:DUF3800 domain-containing protein [Enterococcus faecium]